MEELSPETIKTLREHPVFQQLVKYIAFKIYELDTVSGAAGLSRDEAGDIAIARDIAIQKLLEIFNPLIENRHKKEATEEEIKQAKSKFGLA